jgi:hypothetical protein
VWIKASRYTGPVTQDVEKDCSERQESLSFSSAFSHAQPTGATSILSSSSMAL